MEKYIILSQKQIIELNDFLQPVSIQDKLNKLSLKELRVIFNKAKKIYIFYEDD